MKSNICILNIVVAKVWGGGEQYVYDTAKAMSKLGIKVYIAVDKRNIAMRQRFSEIAEVVDCNLYPAVGIFAVKNLVKFIKEKKINVINCHSGHAMHLCLILKIITKIKLVVFKHNALLAKHDFYHRWQREKTDAFVCVSKLVYNLQTQGLTIKDKSKFYLIYNGIDIEKFNKYKSVYKDKNKFIIGYAGRIADNKGIDVLLQAFLMLSKKYNNIYLQDRVEYLGLIEDMELFYKKLDLFVLPSVVKEAFGLSLCEAMYCSVPVITTDSGAQCELVKDGTNGIIVRKKNINQLYKKIDEFYQNKNLCLKMGICGNEFIKKNFKIDLCVKRLLNLYKILMKSWRRTNESFN